MIDLDRLKELLAHDSFARATKIVASQKRSNRPLNEPHEERGTRLVGFKVHEDVAGLSDALFAMDAIREAVNALPTLISALEAEREKVAARERLLDEHAGARTALANGLLAENARAIVAEAKVAKLREAVRPMAEVSTDVPEEYPDDYQVVTSCGYFRTAARAYKETGDEA